jgi:pimeloyl-ACP methyl ester carboxylesterase
MNKGILQAVILAALVAACGSGVKIEPVGESSFGDQAAMVEEIEFRSGQFRLVGDLRYPLEGGPHPVIILVHGSGGATRDGAVNFMPLIELFLRNGYAVFSWDKPSSGESTGEFEIGYTLTGRAEILVDGVQALTEHPNIDTSQIGVWGVSQAGWVIPLALEMTDDIAFMIVVSGGAENSIEQMAYQVGQQVACRGGTDEEVAQTEELWPQIAIAPTYAEYRQAVETLREIPGVYASTGLELNDEEGWSPWPTDIDAFFDPMDVISHTTIPMLILYGELDKNIDPFQGAQGYEEALAAAGNTSYEVVVISGAGHVLTPAETGCIGEPPGNAYVPEYLEILEAWLQALDL